MNRFWIPAILPILALAGCANQDSRFVGKWHSDTGIDTAKGDQPGDKMLRGLSAFANAVGPQLELKPDHTFTMIFVFTIEGKWTAEGRTVTCTPDHVSGIEMGTDKDSRKPFQLTLAEDGSTLSGTDDSKPNWVLKRGEK